MEIACTTCKGIIHIDENPIDTDGEIWCPYCRNTFNFYDSKGKGSDPKFLERSFDEDWEDGEFPLDDENIDE